MSKNIQVTLSVAIEDEADPDTVAGAIFNLLCGDGLPTECDIAGVESYDGYDFHVEA